MFKKKKKESKRLQCLLERLFLFKSLTIARHEAWLVSTTCDWFTWLHHLHTLYCILIRVCTFVRIINLAHISLILARSSPVNNSYNECHRSDARHSTPSWHAAENALLQHKAEKALDIPCMWTHSQDFKWHPTNNHNLYDFLGKQIVNFFEVDIFHNITNEWDQCCQNSKTGKHCLNCKNANEIR